MIEGTAASMDHVCAGCGKQIPITYAVVLDVASGKVYHMFCAPKK